MCSLIFGGSCVVCFSEDCTQIHLHWLKISQICSIELKVIKTDTSVHWPALNVAEDFRHNLRFVAPDNFRNT